MWGGVGVRGGGGGGGGGCSKFSPQLGSPPETGRENLPQNERSGT